MRVLFASSEAHPLVKTGGLGDVSGSLPDALKRLGADVRVILPGYPQAIERAGAVTAIAELSVGRAGAAVRILEGRLPGSSVPVYLVDAPAYFHRAGHPYIGPDGRDWQDNHLRFGVFNETVAALAVDHTHIGWKPTIVHCNDWQSGLVPALLRAELDRPATIFTIHNLAYQGLFDRAALDEIGLDPALWSMNGLEFYGKLSFMKGGLAFADRLTTVSPTYAHEIRTQQLGAGLEGLLSERADRLTGILNGIDYRFWDPATDPYLPAHYDRDDLTGKAANKEALQSRFALPLDPAAPLLGHIGRMVEQKGTDLLLDALPRLLRRGDVQAVILGSGDLALEDAAQRLAAAWPGRVGAYVGYDERLAHLIEAGSDMFVMPSRFEPCGLNQMYSLRYGTPPIARRTGGLADTVVDASSSALGAGTANGFVFAQASPEALLEACHRALGLFSNRQAWRSLVRQGMSQDFSWMRSAREYLELYRAIR